MIVNHPFNLPVSQRTSADGEYQWLVSPGSEDSVFMRKGSYVRPGNVLNWQLKSLIWVYSNEGKIRLKPIREKRIPIEDTHKTERVLTATSEDGIVFDLYVDRMDYGLRRIILTSNGR